MKAITIKQPWVHAVLHGGKDIENRSWRTNFRGWLAIHAAARRSSHFDFPEGYSPPDPADLPHGAICGVVRVPGVVECSSSKWYIASSPDGRNYDWLLAEPIAFRRPIPAKGSQKLWELPRALERQLRVQLTATCFDC